jgi:nucleoid-associated protein YgaU
MCQVPITVVYTVQKQDEIDGLVGLARRFYGVEQRWTEIYEANRHVIGNSPLVVRSGQQLVIPQILNEHPSSRVRFYTVHPNDIREGLPGIARLLYGDAKHWHVIYAVNRGGIGDDPQQLQPGQCLIIV